MKDIYKKSKQQIEKEFYGSNEEFTPPKQNLACTSFVLFIIIIFLAGVYLLWQIVPYVAHVQNKAEDLRADLKKPKANFWEDWFKHAKDSSKDITNNIKDSAKESIDNKIDETVNSAKDSAANAVQNEIDNQTNQIANDLSQ